MDSFSVLLDFTCTVLNKCYFFLISGYDIIWDNVDIKTDPHQMTSKHQRHDYHLFNVMAYKNRVDGNQLDDSYPQKEISSMNLAEFIPSSAQV